MVEKVIGRLARGVMIGSPPAVAAVTAREKVSDR
jgi:hypothetical protein